MAKVVERHVAGDVSVDVAGIIELEVRSRQRHVQIAVPVHRHQPKHVRRGSARHCAVAVCDDDIIASHRDDVQFAAQVATAVCNGGQTQFKLRAVRDARHRAAGVYTGAGDGSSYYKARRAVAGYGCIGNGDSHASQRAGESGGATGVGPPVAKGVPVLVN